MSDGKNADRPKRLSDPPRIDIPYTDCAARTGEAGRIRGVNEHRRLQYCRRDTWHSAGRGRNAESRQERLAIEILIKHPDWTNVKIAEAVPCTPEFLSVT